MVPKILLAFLTIHCSTSPFMFAQASPHTVPRYVLSSAPPALSYARNLALVQASTPALPHAFPFVIPHEFLLSFSMLSLLRLVMRYFTSFLMRSFLLFLLSLPLLLLFFSFICLLSYHYFFFSLCLNVIFLHPFVYHNSEYKTPLGPPHSGYQNHHITYNLFSYLKSSLTYNYFCFTRGRWR